MEDDTAYRATMQALVHVYGTRDNLIAACVSETAERGRWLLMAASMWIAASETHRALSLMPANAEQQHLRRAVWRSIHRTRVSSYACYRNAGLGKPDQEADMKCIEMQTATRLCKWDPRVQSLHADGRDDALEACGSFFDETSCRTP